MISMKIDNMVMLTLTNLFEQGVTIMSVILTLKVENETIMK